MGDVGDYEAVWRELFGGGGEGSARGFDRVFYLQWLKQAPVAARTPATFRNFVMNSKAFREVQRELFRRVYAETMNPRAGERELEEAFAAFWKERKGTGREAVGGGVGREAVRAWIVGLPAFVEKYRGVITRLYTATSGGKAPAEDVVQLYMRKFVDMAEYDVDALHRDVLEGLAPNVGAHDRGGVVHTIQRVWQETMGAPARGPDVDGLLQILGDTPRTLQMLIAHMHTFQNGQIARCLEDFEAVFERPVTVFEFLKWYPRTYAVGDAAAWETVRERQAFCFKTVVGLYEKYLKRAIGETEFLRRYVDIIDGEDYVERVIDECVRTPTYREWMREEVRRRYKAAYLAELADDDEEYMFGDIQTRRLDLTHPDIDHVITDVYKETQAFTAEIHRLHEAVLQRPADELEHRAWLRRYRQQQDMARTSAELEEELYSSLEYHDILKAALREEFETAKGRRPLPSQLFTLLQAVLARPEVARDRAALGAWIKAQPQAEATKSSTQ